VSAESHSFLPPIDDSCKGSDGFSTLASAFLPSNLFGGPDFDGITQTVTQGGIVHKRNEPPPELVCPIELVLMTNDPVLAADGVTYERVAITNWFETNISKIKKAQESLKINPFSESDRRVVENGITSPTYGTKMANLNLTENINVRNMARDFKRTQAAA
jgi:U-box domain